MRIGCDGCIKSDSKSLSCGRSEAYRGILADVIVYIFAHLHRALRTEGEVLDIN